MGTYLAIAFGGGWLIWIGVIEIGLPRWISILAQFMPALGAVVARAVWGEGYRDSGLSPVPRRGRGWTYLFAYLLVPGALLVAYLVAIPGGLVTATPDIGRALGSSDLLIAAAARWGTSGLLGAFLLAPMIPVLAFGEEFGWRGYLLPRLLPLGPLLGTTLVGVVWALWHLPFNLLYGVNGGMGWLAYFLAYLVMLNFVLCWLTLRSGSVWPAAVLHAASDLQPGIVVVLVMAAYPRTQAEGDLLFNLVVAGVVILTASTLLWRQRLEAAAADGVR